MVDRSARMVILVALLYMIVYIPYFFLQLDRISHGVSVSPFAILPAHFVCMALNIAALILTIRDLYRRPFPEPDTKLTWLLVILFTGGIGWVVYVVKYPLKHRDVPNAA